MILRNENGTLVDYTDKGIATSAEQVAYDENTNIKQKIDTKADKDEAIKNITRSGTTFTATRADGTTFTFTQQDNNTTTGDGIKTKVAKTGSGSTVTNTVAASTTLDNAVGTLLNNDYAIDNAKAPKSEAIKSITRSGTTFTATRCDNTTFTFTQQDSNTWTAMTGATSSANGSVGYVNAVPPKDGYNTKYLRADGTWTIPPNTTTGTTYTAGNVPANTTFATNGSVKNAYDGLNSAKQPKTMSTTIAGQTTVEGCLTQLSTRLTVSKKTTGIDVTGSVATAMSYEIQSMGNLRILNMTFTSTQTLSPNTWQTVGTLSSTDRPARDIPISFNDRNGHFYAGIIGVSGIIKFLHQTNVGAQTDNASINAVWFV